MDIGDQLPNKRSHLKASRYGSATNDDNDDIDPSPPQVGYQLSIIKCIVLVILAALPLFIGLLMAYWWRARWVKLTCFRCPLNVASIVIVKDLDGKERVERVQIAGTDCRYIEHRCLRYVYDPSEEVFTVLRGYDSGMTCEDMHGLAVGLSSSENAVKLHTYGPNSIEVPVKPYYVLFVEEVLHPFYMFQLFSIALWMYEVYYYYAASIFVLSTISVFSSLLQTRQNMEQLRNMARHSSMVTVMREGLEICNVPSNTLVPGDILVIPSTGMTMPCDAALLTGTAVVNESSLTGESCPLTKTSLPHLNQNTHYQPSRFKPHTLFGGTHVIQTRFYANSRVLAVVVTTAFATARGRMVRSIMYPKPLDLKFYADSIKFMCGLACIAVVGFVYTCVLQAEEIGVWYTIVRGLDVVTTVVPPALPAALTVGTVYALQRLRKKHIYCISPQRVNLCGKVKLVCFDKTGTLTEDGMNMYGVVETTNQMLTDMVKDPSTLDPDSPLLRAMATCHSLTLINGQVAGDPLDVKMFTSTGWTLNEPGEDTSRFDTLMPATVTCPTQGGKVELGIVKQFTFASDLQRMSVLVRPVSHDDPKHMTVFVKGAPEKITQLCLPETVPSDFHVALGSLTHRGLRVIAVGHRTIQAAFHKTDKIERDQVECDLTFAGLIAMENTLKPETTPVITTLREAAIRTVMITGDNLLTAVSVARGCKMVAPDDQTIVMKAELLVSSTNLDHKYSEKTGLLASSHKTSTFGIHYSLLDAGVDGGKETRSEKKGNQEFKATMDANFHLVIEGSSFQVVRSDFPDLYQKLLVKGTVFARMAPDQKAQLVTDLQTLGYGVCMCGDGANDCGALKAAHVGISLSEAEASVASPFTSKTPNITCVPVLLQEGRAAITTSFSTFKYMALYSLVLFSSVSILYWHFSYLGDKQYLYGDMVIILGFSFVMGITGSYPQLAKRRPPGTLAGIHVLFSLVIHVALAVSFQVAGIVYLHSRLWYEVGDFDSAASSENTVIFQFLMFQYIFLALALSTGPPYRKPIYTNIPFMVCLAVTVPCTTYLTLAPADWLPGLWSFMTMRPPPFFLFRVAIFEMILLYITLTYLLEAHVFHSEWWHTILRVIRFKRTPRNRYKHVLKSIDPQWPPLDEPCAETVQL
ncbi:hypothetical protein EMCRGX_G010855 [Ephydatia muelleri]